MRPLILAIIATVATLGLTAPVQAQDSWRTYENSLFGYSVLVPPRFIRDGETAEGRGQRFRGRPATYQVDGLLISGSLSAEAIRRASLLRADGWRIIHRRHDVESDAWAELSAEKEGRNLRIRMIRLCDPTQIATLEFEYLARDSWRITMMPEIISRSFRSRDC